MPLRDHFHPPLSEHRRWEGFHAAWPSVMIRQIHSTLPENLYAEPRVRLGKFPESPTASQDADLDEFDRFAVEIYRDNQTLVAVIELVSERNKDRPEARADFVGKVAGLLRSGVCTTVIDVVTNRHFNLYAEALDLLGLAATIGRAPMPHLYAATVRRRPGVRRSSIVESWFQPLTVGQPLPSLPVWLDDRTHLILDLEASYEETCRTLRIA